MSPLPQFHTMKNAQNDCGTVTNSGSGRILRRNAVESGGN